MGKVTAIAVFKDTSPLHGSNSNPGSSICVFGPVAMATRNDPDIVKRFSETLQADLRTLSTECRRKYAPVKEASESALLRIHTIQTKHSDFIAGILGSSSDIVNAFVLGCDTKNPKIVHHCLSAIQKLIQHEAMSFTAAMSVINTLWVLMEAGVEELKLLQTAILLITTNTVVQHEALARALVLCFRLHFTKDSTTINTAAATVRQLVTMVFERVMTEDKVESQQELEPTSLEVLKNGSKQAPKSLRPCAGDAFLLFQDFCQLVNADQPYWLIGMTEMTRTFGLELMESVLTTFPEVFIKHPEFTFLLKERVCPLVIKLFSPSLKYRPLMQPTGGNPQADKPYFPIVIRLLRIVSVLIRFYYDPLVTECEIFLSLLVKFLDGEKPMWQRAGALEVLYKFCSQPSLLKRFCQSYDMKQHSTKIFRDIVNGLGSFIQSMFMALSSSHSQTAIKAPDTTGHPPSLVAGMPVGGGVTPQPAFCHRNVWIPLVVNASVKQGAHKAVYTEMLDRTDPPNIQDGYCLSVAFVSLLDVVRCIQGIIEEALAAKAQTAEEAESDELNTELVQSSWCGVLAALTLLLDASTDESATEQILKAEQTLANLCGVLALNTPRDAFITALCKASLPPHYALTILNSGAGASSTNTPLSRASSTKNPESTSGSGSPDVYSGSQVVAVGTPLPTSSLPLGAQQGAVMLTAKNIQCMRAILSLAHCHGSILGSAWHQVLTTLQVQKKRNCLVMPTQHYGYAFSCVPS
ncbi:hypothetical protein CAPTEDRAFT_201502 [Capitella teleta]|uniref:Protein MON2 homolog n=1 Tax=Capitella teleta TaxID=283909 RepID=R7ULJ2_CAPTE|nr:hypothetical protein CAPTEDRAFT_201502 [Capitella teleta]|eukprot:ELU04807.1 hypothetical protein CAPTEDRAFT_201502 [Capitella teleta]